MRIFLTGSQGTGKSTLNDALLINYTNLDKVDSISRLFIKDKGRDIQIVGKKGNDEFQRKILLYALNIYVNREDFISSRSHLDTLAYIKGSEYELDLVDMINIYRDDLFNKDSYYVYLPIEFEISSKGNDIRPVDKIYQSEIDKRIYIEFINAKKLSRYPDNFIEVRGTVEERVETITNLINK